MSRKAIGALLTVSLLIFGPAAAYAQAAGAADPHHPDATQDKAPPSAAPGAGPVTGAAGGMPGMMGMMTPEMMQMMQQMMRMQGEGSGQPGMMMCPMMAMMMSGQAGDGEPSATRRSGMGVGPGMFYGMAPGTPAEMTPERVRTWLEERLARHANPRLKIGKIAKAESGETTAEIVTVDGSLVQKLAFNRYPGFARVVP
jgi:hypothetical protein